MSGGRNNQNTRNPFNHKTFTIAEGVKAKVYFKASPQPTEDGFTFMNIESVKMDFSVRDIKMGVNNIANGNSIIRKLSSRGITWTGH